MVTVKKSFVSTVLLLIAGALLCGVAIGVYFVTAGVSARPQPARIESFAAHAVRGVAIRTRTRALTNPVTASDAVIKEGMEHFADHCAVCHGNDGSGNTEMGRGLYPRAPDMRLPATQSLSDGELFYIIENGVRLTGMPAWSTGTKEGETSSWHLVHFIRHLPKLSDEDIELMESLNPKSPEDVRQEIEAEKFLQGGDPEPPSPNTHQHTGAH
jgi:mono/diheme cytochrome c family protein